MSTLNTAPTPEELLIRALAVRDTALQILAYLLLKHPEMIKEEALIEVANYTITKAALEVFDLEVELKARNGGGTP